MKPLNKQFAPKSVMPEKVIQFGEGNFLRAFVDWIIWNMDQKTDFNGSVVVMYWLLIQLLGLSQVMEDFEGMGAAMLAALLILGNVTFFLLDRLLGKRKKKGSRG